MSRLSAQRSPFAFEHLLTTRVPIAVVFSTVILRPDPSATPDSLSLSSSIPRRRQNFILLLLEESQEDVNLDTRK